MLRFSHSPIGDMSIDSLRVAILNYLVSQQKSEQFLVRIDDIEIEANIEGKDTETMMILEKFALNHDSVFHQSEHLNLHQTLAIRLLKEEKAFICRCIESERCSKRCKNLTKEEQTKLKDSKEPFVTRVDIDSFIILKIDGKPTHDFATLCDDMISDISIIIDDESNIINSNMYEQVKTLLGYNRETLYYKLPSILNSCSIKSLLKEGFLPDAILNYLIVLSCPEAPKEFFTLPEAIEWFRLDNLSELEVEFDIELLRSINREHLNRFDNKELSKLFGFADEDIGKLVKVYLEEATTIKELEEKILPIFKPKDFTLDCGKEMRLLSDIIFDSPVFEEFKEFRGYTLKRSGLKEDIFDKALSFLLTNREDNSKLSKIYPFIKSYILEVAS